MYITRQFFNQPGGLRTLAGELGYEDRYPVDDFSCDFDETFFYNELVRLLVQNAKEASVEKDGKEKTHCFGNGYISKRISIHPHYVALEEEPLSALELAVHLLRRSLSAPAANDPDSHLVWFKRELCPIQSDLTSEFQKVLVDNLVPVSTRCRTIFDEHREELLALISRLAGVEIRECDGAGGHKTYKEGSGDRWVEISPVVSEKAWVVVGESGEDDGGDGGDLVPSVPVVDESSDEDEDDDGEDLVPSVPMVGDSSDEDEDDDGGDGGDLVPSVPVDVDLKKLQKQLDSIVQDDIWQVFLEAGQNARMDKWVLKTEEDVKCAKTMITRVFFPELAGLPYPTNSFYFSRQIVHIFRDQILPKLFKLIQRAAKGLGNLPEKLYLLIQGVEQSAKSLVLLLTWLFLSFMGYPSFVVGVQALISDHARGSFNNKTRQLVGELQRAFMLVGIFTLVGDLRRGFMGESEATDPTMKHFVDRVPCFGLDDEQLKKEELTNDVWDTFRKTGLLSFLLTDSSSAGLNEFQRASTEACKAFSGSRIPPISLVDEADLLVAKEDRMQGLSHNMSNDLLSRYMSNDLLQLHKLREKDNIATNWCAMFNKFNVFNIGLTASVAAYVILDYEPSDFVELDPPPNYVGYGHRDTEKVDIRTVHDNETIAPFPSVVDKEFPANRLFSMIDAVRDNTPGHQPAMLLLAAVNQIAQQQKLADLIVEHYGKSCVVLINSSDPVVRSDRLEVTSKPGWAGKESAEVRCIKCESVTLAQREVAKIVYDGIGASDPVELVVQIGYYNFSRSYNAPIMMEKTDQSDKHAVCIHPNGAIMTPLGDLSCTAVGQMGARPFGLKGEDFQKLTIFTTPEFSSTWEIYHAVNGALKEILKWHFKQVELAEQNGEARPDFANCHRSFYQLLDDSEAPKKLPAIDRPAVRKWGKLVKNAKGQPKMMYKVELDYAGDINQQTTEAVKSFEEFMRQRSESEEFMRQRSESERPVKVLTRLHMIPVREIFDGLSAMSWDDFMARYPTDESRKKFREALVERFCGEGKQLRALGTEELLGVTWKEWSQGSSESREFDNVGSWRKKKEKTKQEHGILFAFDRLKNFKQEYVPVVEFLTPQTDDSLRKELQGRLVAIHKTSCSLAFYQEMLSDALCLLVEPTYSKAKVGEEEEAGATKVKGDSVATGGGRHATGGRRKVAYKDDTVDLYSIRLGEAHKDDGRWANTCAVLDKDERVCFDLSTMQVVSPPFRPVNVTQIAFHAQLEDKIQDLYFQYDGNDREEHILNAHHPTDAIIIRDMLGFLYDGFRKFSLCQWLRDRALADKSRRTKVPTQPVDDALPNLTTDGVETEGKGTKKRGIYIEPAPSFNKARAEEILQVLFPHDPAENLDRPILDGKTRTFPTLIGTAEILRIGRFVASSENENFENGYSPLPAGYQIKYHGLHQQFMYKPNPGDTDADLDGSFSLYMTGRWTGKSKNSPETLQLPADQVLEHGWHNNEAQRDKAGRKFDAQLFERKGGASSINSPIDILGLRRYQRSGEFFTMFFPFWLMYYIDTGKTDFQFDKLNKLVGEPRWRREYTKVVGEAGQFPDAFPDGSITLVLPPPREQKTTKNDGGEGPVRKKPKTKHNGEMKDKEKRKRKRQDEGSGQDGDKRQRRTSDHGGSSRQKVGKNLGGSSRQKIGKEGMDKICELVKLKSEGKEFLIQEAIEWILRSKLFSIENKDAWKARLHRLFKEQGNLKVAKKQGKNVYRFVD
ncbi:hypothetical protein HK104_011480 [Borealophlyctis nickersoniae]|nr:hypothetical protein HK104_011480 [Borealophlyctis nickersoniae]